VCSSSKRNEWSQRRSDSAASGFSTARWLLRRTAGGVVASFHTGCRAGSATACAAGTPSSAATDLGMELESNSDIRVAEGYLRTQTAHEAVVIKSLTRTTLRDGARSTRSPVSGNLSVS